MMYINQTTEKMNVRNAGCDIKKHDVIAESRYMDKQNTNYFNI